MTKRSKYEQAQRAEEDQRTRDIGAAWMARLSPEETLAFRAQIDEVRARPIPEKPPQMAPGTQPNPPRPGREPRPTKAEEQRRTRH